jgi:hypothetical protein
MTFASSAVSPIGQYSSVAMTVDPHVVVDDPDKARREAWAGLCLALAHRVGQRNVAVETAGFGPGTVVLAEIAITGLVAARFGDQGIEP